MTNLEKVLLQVLRGTSDANSRFEDLCNLLVSADLIEEQVAATISFENRGLSRKSIFRKKEARRSLTKFAKSETSF